MIIIKFNRKLLISLIIIIFICFFGISIYGSIKIKELENKCFHAKLKYEALKSEIQFTQPPIIIDKEYLYALRTADRYLCAWVMRDGSIAYDLISDNIKNNYADVIDFQKYFAGVSNPHHQAFEIIGYKHISENRICFKVWYYEDYIGIYEPPYKKPYPSFLEVVKVDKEKWLVDKVD
jgi:hypothetical protein